LTKAGIAIAHPGAFVAATLLILGWLVFAPESFDWHAAVTVVTLYIALFIQRATHRDTQALHAKVDELILASKSARNSLTIEDEREPEEIEDRRAVQRP
jgi:low affinity Fe/Cu permease